MCIGSIAKARQERSVQRRCGPCYLIFWYNQPIPRSPSAHWDGSFYVNWSTLFVQLPLPFFALLPLPNSRSSLPSATIRPCIRMITLLISIFLPALRLKFRYLATVHCYAKMFTPTWVQLKYWYHPIRNIPAVDLLRDLPPPDVEETVNVLSLACGDPGNIFFSLWCEQRHETNRTIHFTCYDIEPAVLARNVVLLTLTAGTNSRTELWNLSYSFFLPKSSLETLHNQVARLLKASESTEK